MKDYRKIAEESLREHAMNLVGSLEVIHPDVEKVTYDVSVIRHDDYVLLSCELLWRENDVEHSMMWVDRHEK